MNKVPLNQYLKLAFDAGLIGKRSWRIQAMMKTTNPITKPYYAYMEDGVYKFVDGQGEVQELETRDPNLSLMTWKTKITLQPGDLPNITEVTETQYGIWLFNVIAWVRAWGKDAPFVNTPINPGLAKKTYIKIRQSGVGADDAVFIKAMSDAETLLSSDSEFGVKSSSRTMLMDDPEGQALADKLLKEYGDRIEDPVVQAEFDTKMIAHLQKRIAGTGAADYYGKGGKLYGTVLMKTDYRVGSDLDTAGGDTQFVPTPLKAGWNLDYMESWVNGGIAGSYSRGNLTALSGVQVKRDNLAYNILEVADNKDCGTKTGLPVFVHAKNSRIFDGSFIVGKEKDGPVDAAKLKELEGQWVTFRSPSHCLDSKFAYCTTCMGGSTIKHGINNGVTELDSRLMYIRMKAGHGYSKESVKIDLMRHCS